MAQEINVRPSDSPLQKKLFDAIQKTNDAELQTLLILAFTEIGGLRATIRRYRSMVSSANNQFSTLVYMAEHPEVCEADHEAID